MIDSTRHWEHRNGHFGHDWSRSTL